MLESKSSELYLDLMKRCLINLIYEDPNIGAWTAPGFDRERRLNGRDWPRDAHSMVGMKRLNNLQECIVTALREKIPGDVIETGVWRGGASIFPRAVLKAYEVSERVVWVADSFEGLPAPNAERYKADKGDIHHEYEYLAVSLEQVRSNFERYGLLDDQVRFLKGWFRDTLPQMREHVFSVCRLDGDMYESTIDALENLYPSLSPGGFIIIDDYKVIPGCREAVEFYRTQNNIDETIIEIDWAGVYWRKR